MLIIDYTNHRHWLLGMSFISGCGRGDSIVLQNIVDRCTIRQIIETNCRNISSNDKY